MKAIKSIVLGDLIEERGQSSYLQTKIVSRIVSILIIVTAIFYILVHTYGFMNFEEIMLPLMKLNTAGCALLCALAIINHTLTYKNSNLVTISLCAVVFYFSINILIESGMIIHMKIDSFLEPQLEDLNAMLPISALGFICVSLSLLISLGNSKAATVLYQTLLTALLIETVFSIIGHMFDAQTFYISKIAATNSWLASVFFFFLGVSVFCLYPQRGVMRVISSVRPGGFAARRLSVLGIIIPICIGGLILKGMYLNLYTVTQGIAFFAMAYIIIFMFISLTISRSLNESDIGRLQIQERLRAAMDAANVGTWRLEVQSKVYTRDSSFNKILGVGSGSTSSFLDDCFSHIHTEDRDRVELAIRKAMETLSPYKEEYRVCRSDGLVRWLKDQGRAVLGFKDEKKFITGAIVDITDLKVAESERLALAKNLESRAVQLQKLAQVFMAVTSNSSIDYVLQVIADEVRGIIGADRAVITIVEEKNGNELKNVSSFLNQNEKWQILDTKINFSQIFNEISEKNKAIRMDNNQIRESTFWRDYKGAEKRFVPRKGWLAAPLFDMNGASIGFIQVFDKVEGEFLTEDESIFMQLAQMATVAIQNARLLIREQDAVKTRDEFLSIASHELKTPLTSLKLQLQIQKRKIDKGEADALQTDRIVKLVNICDKQVDRLSRLVDDMLDVGRIKSGKLTLQLEEFDLSLLAKEVVERLYPQIEQSGSMIIVDAPQEVVGWWDKFRVEQILLNVLTNAVKYGEGSAIHVKVGFQDGFAVLSVKDHGRGIASDNIEKIFQRFQQIGSKAIMSGLGLGLYIVKHIVAMHEGTIEVKSELGQGADFIIKLPLKILSQDDKF